MENVFSHLYVPCVYCQDIYLSSLCIREAFWLCTNFMKDNSNKKDCRLSAYCITEIPLVKWFYWLFFRHSQFSRNQYCRSEQQGRRWRDLCRIHYERVRAISGEQSRHSPSCPRSVPPSLHHPTVRISIGGQGGNDGGIYVESIPLWKMVPEYLQMFYFG